MYYILWLKFESLRVHDVAILIVYIFEYAQLHIFWELWKNNKDIFCKDIVLTYWFTLLCVYCSTEERNVLEDNETISNNKTLVVITITAIWKWVLFCTFLCLRLHWYIAKTEYINYKTHTLALTHAHTHTHTHIHMPAAYMHAHRRTHRHSCMHTQTLMHTRTHARLHTHTQLNFICQSGSHWLLFCASQKQKEA